MKYNVIVDEIVKLQLDNYVRFSTNVSTKFAKSIRTNFYNALYELQNNPDRFPLWQPSFEVYKPYHNILIKKRYSVIYYIEDNNIFIDYLLDCHMDNSKLF